MASPVTDTTPKAPNEPATTAPPPSLQDRIQTLTDVHNRLQALRHMPSMLLKPPSASLLSDFSPPFDPTVDQDFIAAFNSTPARDLHTLKEFSEVLCSEKVQEALRAARASEEADQSELGSSFRRENRKRKRPQSPVGSPQPYIPPPPRSSSLFSPIEDDPPPLRAESLFEFLREFNRGNLVEFKRPVPSELDGPSPPRCRLAIWLRTKTLRDELGVASSSAPTSVSSKPRGGKLTSPAVIRFVIPDVLTAYVSLIFTSLDSPLVVESVTAFGPRERKLPHEQSDYLALQVLSQHLAKTIQSHPRVPLQILINLLVSYRGLFVDRCTSCERVLSAEGHIPPVGRVWVAKEQLPPSNTSGKTSDADIDTPGGPADPAPGSSGHTEPASGHWEPRHVTCLYS
ncbi:hypothetical protein PAXRUDRAFT_827543 [Paxillus rubicundulus Ve08.2h10]|uniref:Mediator of RNA polymerase II transcription subunit 27 n=1 Tax=Paxillus rubicundulus Ve08.2h10 TaxID=930991 RepID=A0A0D0DCF0_9AGAM|nr:hypothetical protein PAXRUDRAFT_827543 [Paxillus rubicundulus Ve08.2h10]